MREAAYRRDMEERQVQQQAVPTDAFAPAQITRTTAEPRPNAYIPDDIGIPKPYGACSEQLIERTLYSKHVWALIAGCSWQVLWLRSSHPHQVGDCRICVRRGHNLSKSDVFLFRRLYLHLRYTWIPHSAHHSSPEATLGLIDSVGQHVSSHASGPREVGVPPSR